MKLVQENELEMIVEEPVEPESELLDKREL